MTGLVLSKEFWGIGLIAFNELGEISHCVSKWQLGALRTGCKGGMTGGCHSAYLFITHHHTPLANCRL